MSYVSHAFFFFSSRRRHTRCSRDWSSDVCSSDLQNVLRDGLILPRTPDPAAMVIFGASGDLTARKLMPALYNLALNRYLPSGFSVIGVADTALTEDEFRAHMEQAVQKYSRSQPVDRAVWQSLAEGISYVRMPFDDAAGYGRLAAELDRLGRGRGA